MLEKRQNGIGKELVFISILTMMSLIILAYLGKWQLDRAVWKTELILKIRAQMEDDAVGLEVVEIERNAEKDIRFRRVALSGVYDHENEIHLYDLYKRVPGWRIITPLYIAPKHYVLIDRGFVSEELKDPATRPESRPPGVVDLTGMVRTHSEGKGIFVPSNEPEMNRWYWYSLTNMMAKVTDKMGVKGEHFYVQLDRPDQQGRWPVAIKVNPKMTNNHFGYALTWFALAIALAGVYASYVFSRLHRSNK